MSNTKFELHSLLDIQLARVGYKAYTVTQDPHDALPFPLLPESQRADWIRVADAIKSELIKRIEP